MKLEPSFKEPLKSAFMALAWFALGGFMLAGFRGLGAGICLWLGIVSIMAAEEANRQP